MRITVYYRAALDKGQRPRRRTFSPHTLRRLIGPRAAPAAGRGGGPACIRRRTPAALRGRIVCARPCCSRCSLPARLARPPARTGRLPAPLAPSATARPTRRACPTPPAPAAPGAVRQRLYASASYGAPVPGGRTLLHRLQMLRGCKSLGILRGRQGPCRGRECSFAQARR